MNWIAKNVLVEIYKNNTKMRDPNYPTNKPVRRPVLELEAPDYMSSMYLEGRDEVDLSKWLQPNQDSLRRDLEARLLWTQDIILRAQNPKSPADIDKSALDDLTEFICRDRPELRREKIYEALEYAEKQHYKQLRNNGRPFICHPVKVGYMLAHYLSADENTVIAGILHDTIDKKASEHKKTIKLIRDYNGDNITTNALYKKAEMLELEMDMIRRKIQEKFGEEVYNLVNAVTDPISRVRPIDKTKKQEKQEAYESVEKSSENDPWKRAKAIKVCDAASNLMTIHQMTSTQDEDAISRQHRKMIEYENFIYKWAEEIDQLYHPNLKIKSYIESMVNFEKARPKK